MMLLQTFNFSCQLQKISDPITSPDAHFVTRKKFRVPYLSLHRVSKLVCHAISLHDISDVLHNKVLVTAGVSAAIGQLSKPFTSTIFCGNKFDFKNAIRAGGFPSTHSSAVVATATSLALERGFSDAIFGLAIVYASLVMYDAQGVRREVGIHAREFNKVLLSSSQPASSRDDVSDLTSCFSREPSSSTEKINLISLEEDASFKTKVPNSSSLLVKSDDRIQSASFVRSSSAASNVDKGSETAAPLKESIGHTEIEVAAGALLGFVVSLALCSYI